MEKLTGPYAQFETSPDLERDGIVIDYGTFQFVIARAGGANADYERVLQRLVRPYRRAAQAGTLDSKVRDDLVRQAFSETVVKGWKGVKGRDGNEIPFSPVAARKLFEDLPELFADLLVQSMTVANFLREGREADAGNSGSSSAGS